MLKFLKIDIFNNELSLCILVVDEDARSMFLYFYNISIYGF